MSDFTCFEYFARVLEVVPSEDDRKTLALSLIYYGTRGEYPDLKPDLIPTFEALRESIDNSVKARTSNKGGRRKKTQDAEESKADDAEKETGVSDEKTGVLETETPVSETETLTVPNLDKPNLDKPKRERSRFKPPTVEDVRAYCSEKGYAVDAERFVDFYGSKGWMVGRNKMKDWRAAVRTWVKRDAPKAVKDYAKYDR